MLRDLANLRAITRQNSRNLTAECLSNQEVPRQAKKAQGALQGERRGRPHVRLQGSRPDNRQSVRGAADQQVSRRKTAQYDTFDILTCNTSD